MAEDNSREFERAWEAFLGRRYEEAAEAFQRLADPSQRDSAQRLHALSLKATCLARMGRPEAKALAEEVLAQQPDHFNARKLLAALNASRSSEESRLSARVGGHGKNDEPCRSYDELCQRVSRLPSPPSGYTHVFRGQNGDFGAMLPSGLRGKRLRNDAIWNCYSWHLGIDLKRREPDWKVDDDVLSFCVRAIAQHYGPGSEFLDVTRSKEVALWFALNEPKTYDVVSPEDTPPKLRDIPYALKRSKVSVTRYRARASGVFYVFLVPEWDGVGPPSHGHLIDLRRRAARPFSSSERIRIQDACLLPAGPAILDLSNFYACDPITVERPMTGASGLDDLTDKMFPGPTRDLWFRRLLSIPLVFMVDDEAKELAVDRPLVVTPYYSGSEDDVRELASGVFLPPVLDLILWESKLSKVTTEAMSRLSKEAAAWLKVSPRDSSLEWANATHILLEAPVLADVPTIGSGRWNLSILGFDLADTVEAFSLRDGQSCGAQSLKNIFLEFSPLEFVLWDKSEELHGEFLRAASLVRNGNRFVLRIILQGISPEHMNMRVLEPPAYYQFDGKRRFDICFPEERRRVPAKGTVWHEVVFFVILAILRKLSPWAKVDPIVPFAGKGNDGVWRYGVHVDQGATLRLVRVASPNGRNWHFLRTVKTNGPFAAVRLRSADLAKIPTPLDATVARYDSRVPWSEIDAASLRNILLEKTEKRVDAFRGSTPERRSEMGILKRLFGHSGGAKGQSEKGVGDESDGIKYMVRQTLMEAYIARSHGDTTEDTADRITTEALAERGMATHQYNLGVRYQQGQGVPLDCARAASWYRKAAEQGLAPAQVNLGLLYAQGQGVPQDNKEAVKWFREAAKQAFPDGCYKLGVMYANGTGVPQDNEEALRLIDQAAAKGHEEALAARDAVAQRAVMERMRREHR